MKKIILFSLLVVSAFSASADPIKKSRETLSTELSSTVRNIKEGFSGNESQIDVHETQIYNANELVKDLVSLSEEGTDGETNPTVLIHAKSQIPSCASSTPESNENTCVSKYDLVWTGTQWDWRQPSAKSDCTPAAGESKVSDGKGGYKCVQSGTYSLQSNGYGECIDPPGKRYSKTKCVFTNDATGVSYEVASSNCSGSITSTTKTCGYKWKLTGYGVCQPGNIQQANYSCVSRVTGAVVNNSKCNHTSKPSSSQSCNYIDGTWIVSSWLCSAAECGKSGVQKRTVGCSGQYCDPATKPATTGGVCTGPCQEKGCKSDSITKSKKAMHGPLKGNLYCNFVLGTSDHGVTTSGQPSGYCGFTPSGDATCSGSFTCDNGTWKVNSWSGSCGGPLYTGRWVVSNWSACGGAACGKTGTQTRTITCSGGMCDPRTKPKDTTSQSCSMPACAVKCPATVISKSKQAGGGYTARCNFRLSETVGGTSNININTTGRLERRGFNSIDTDCKGTFTCSNSGSWTVNSWGLGSGSGGSQPKGTWQNRSGSEVGNGGSCSWRGSECSPIGSTRICCGPNGTSTGSGCRANNGRATIDPVVYSCK